MGERWRPSELNRRVTAAYEACLADGGHIDSGERVDRPVQTSAGRWRMAVCARCKVPFESVPAAGYGRTTHGTAASRA